MKPLITTVIPTYKRPQYLKRAINSVLNQSYRNFHVCVYDNASGDETKEVVENISRRDNRIKYHCHSRNIGAIANFNYGLNQIKTEYFSILADDNVLFPNFFEQSLEQLKLNSQLMFCAGQVLFLTPENRVVNISITDWPEGIISPPNGLVHIWEHGIPTWEGVLFRKAIIDSIGDFDLQFKASIDQDYMMRIARNFPFVIFKKPVATFLLHNGSLSSNRKLDEIINTEKKLANKWLSDESLAQEHKRKIQRRLKSIHKNSLASFLYQEGIIGKNSSVIKVAEDIIKRDLIKSIKVRRMIYLVKLAHLNGLLYKVCKLASKIYIKLRIYITELHIKKKQLSDLQKYKGLIKDIETN